MLVALGEPLWLPWEQLRPAESQKPPEITRLNPEPLSIKILEPHAADSHPQETKVPVQWVGINAQTFISCPTTYYGAIYKFQ